MPDPTHTLKRGFPPTNPPRHGAAASRRDARRAGVVGDASDADGRAPVVPDTTERRAPVMPVLIAAALIGGAGIALIVAGESRAATPSVERQPGVLSHYGPTTEPTGPVACGRGTIPAGVHGVAMRDQPCGTRIGMCLPDLSACVQARVVDYGPGIASRSHDGLERTFAAVAPLSRGVVPIVWRVQPVKRCVPRWVKTYWRPAQGLGGRYAPTCGTAAAR